MAGYIKADTSLIKLKSIFIGDDLSKAKKIKKAYMGDSNNIARLIWSGGDGGMGSVSYYGNAPTLTLSRAYMGSANTSELLVFAGGLKNSSAYPTVDAYNESLQKKSLSTITSRGRMGSASFNGYAVFAGGQKGSSSVTDVVEAFDPSGAKVTLDELSDARGALAGGATDNFMYFGGGYYMSSGNYICVDDVDVYDVNRTHTTSRRFSGHERSHLASVSTPDYVFFAGGQFYEWEDLPSNEREWWYVDDIDVFDNNGSCITSLGLKKGKSGMAGACAGEYVIFAGGYSNNGTSWQSINPSKFMEYYHSDLEIVDANLTKINNVVGYIGMNDPAGSSLGKCAIFAGGSDGEAYYGLEVFDEEQIYEAVRWLGDDDSVTTIGDIYEMSESRSGLAAGTIGNYALFAGGIIDEDESEYSTAVDVMMIE